jgi:hypothetical protein
MHVNVRTFVGLKAHVRVCWSQLVLGCAMNTIHYGVHICHEHNIQTVPAVSPRLM